MGTIGSKQHTEAVDATGTPSSEILSAMQQLVTSHSSPILTLPTEILQQILSYFDERTLVLLSRTCRTLQTQAANDALWATLLRHHLPQHSFPLSPSPSPSYRHLYLTHYPNWFLPQHRIWFSDDPYTGKLILIVYRPHTGRIEGYRLAATRPPSVPVLWSIRPGVVIHTSSPEVYLSTEDPVLSLPHFDLHPTSSPKGGRFANEIRMTVGHPHHRIHASFFLTRTIPPHLDSRSMEVWPPRTIPDMPRARAYSGDKFQSRGHKPARLEDVSTTTFRTRCWSNYGAGVAGSVLSAMRMSVGMEGALRIGEEVSTWSTLAEHLYLPTVERPYQGIFVGDYASHGCEFLLVMMGEKGGVERWPRREYRSDGGYFRTLLASVGGLGEDGEVQSSSMGTEGVGEGEKVLPNVPESEYVHQGSLQAVKLTGDINVPRGEHTFIAEDIGQGGFIRVAHEAPFRGARVVRSRGHVAARGFREDEFIPSELILVSPDLLAQYWLPFGHISFYKRVKIDELVANISGERRASS